MSAEEALRHLRERIEAYVEHAEQDAVIEVDGTDWAQVIYQEAAYLVQNGPEAYVGYVRRLDDEAVRAQLDSELDAILRQGGLA